MRINPLLRAYARYTQQGALIPGSVVMRKKQPAGKNWREIVINICCSNTTSTTTTTSTTSTTTTSTTTTTTTLP